MSCVFCHQEIMDSHNYSFFGTQIFLPSEQEVMDDVTYDKNNICLTCAQLIQICIEKKQLST